MITLYRSSKSQAEIIVNYAKKEMEKIKGVLFGQKSVSSNVSVADELFKLAKLKEQGILTEEEFAKMKRDFSNKNST